MLWEKTQEILQTTLPQNVYSLWIKPLKCLEVKEESISLLTPDRYFSAYVNNNFLPDIEKSLAQLDNVQRKVVFCEAERQEIPEVNSQRQQLRLPAVPQNCVKKKSLHPRYTFDEYMVGESNILAESACRAISGQDDSFGTTLFINSDTGLGKSHLTQAIAHRVYSDFPAIRLQYVTAQRFTQEMVHSIQARTMDQFKRKYHEQCDMLLVEDIHQLAGKKKTQEELNEALDFLIKGGKRVVFTAKNSPRNLYDIDSELRSRMSAGLVTRITAPDVATRLRIAKNKANQHKLVLGSECFDYLAQHIRGDVRQVESAIVAIQARARLQGGQVGMDMIREVVAGVVGSEKLLTIATISDLIASQYKVTVKDMQSRSRKKNLTFPRQVAMYLCRKHTEDSLADIGRAFNRDHSTVLHSIKKVTTMKNRSASIEAQMEMLNDKIQEL